MWSVFLSTNRADKCFNVTYTRPVNGMDMQRAEIAFCKSKALFAPARAVSALHPRVSRRERVKTLAASGGSVQQLFNNYVE